MNIEIQHWKWNRVFKRWECLRTSAYAVQPAVVEAFRVSHALAQKRQQLAVQHPSLPAARISFACESEV